MHKALKWTFISLTTDMSGGISCQRNRGCRSSRDLVVSKRVKMHNSVENSIPLGTKKGWLQVKSSLGRLNGLHVAVSIRQGHVRIIHPDGSVLPTDPRQPLYGRRVSMLHGTSTMKPQPYSDNKSALGRVERSIKSSLYQGNAFCRVRMGPVFVESVQQCCEY
jgi:hypothetical protein